MKIEFPKFFLPNIAVGIFLLFCSQIGWAQEHPDPLLVTAIDLDTVMARTIKDYKNFRKSYDIGENVMAVRWRVKPDPNLLETQYFGKPLKESPFYKREIKISIGVYRSPEEAVRRTVDYVQGDMAIVRDNVFLSVDFCTEPFDRNEIMKALERDLLEGADGIEKGQNVSIPTISIAIPERLTLSAQSNATATVYVEYPERIHAQPYLWFVEERDGASDPSVSSPPVTKNSVPVLHWIDDSHIELLERGSVKGRLKAVVVSDGCVFSDVWEKAIEIVVSADGDKQ